MRKHQLLLPEDLDQAIATIAKEESEGKLNPTIRKLLREALAARLRSRTGIDAALVGTRPLDHFHPGNFGHEPATPAPAAMPGEWLGEVPEDAVRPERGADPFGH